MNQLQNENKFLIYFNSQSFEWRVSNYILLEKLLTRVNSIVTNNENEYEQKVLLTNRINYSMLLKY